MNDKITQTIKKVENLNKDILKYDKLVKELKFNYDTSLLNLKYSERYTEYKTIKEKEERAKMETKEYKAQIINAESQLEQARHDKEVEILKLKYLYAPNVE